MCKSIVCLFAICLVCPLWAADPFAGTWKLNLKRSKFEPGPAPKIRIMKIEARESGYNYEIDNVDAQGNPTNRRNSIFYDGNEHLLSPDSDATIAVRKIEDNIHEIVIRQGGKQVQAGHEVVSPDGKTMTRTVKGTSSQGQEYLDILVYDRQ